MSLSALSAAPVLALVRLPALWIVLGLAYAGLGAALAWHLGRLGHGLGTSSMALLCWPLLLGLIGRPPPDPSLLVHAAPRSTPAGPNAPHIDACLANLRRGLLDDEAGRSVPLIDELQLRGLGVSLHRADDRIARVDRLLRETDRELEQLRGLPREAHDPRPLAGEDAALRTALDQLRRARSHAQTELEAVLAGLLSLRVQLGMFALAGEAEPVRERLAEFEARVAALAELSSIELAQVQP